MDLVNEVFTDTDGAAINPSTWTAAAGGSTTISIISNAWKVNCGAVASQFGNAWLLRREVRGDMDIYIDFIIPNPIAGLSRQSVYWHSNNVSPLNAYSLLVRHETGTYELGYYTNDVFTNMSTTLASGLAAGDTIHFRIQHRGSNVKLKKWHNAAVEPATWTLDMTAAVSVGQFPYGIFSLELYNNTAAACSGSFDNIIVTTPNNPVPVTSTYYRR